MANMLESFEAFMALPAPTEDLDLWISPTSAIIAERVWQAAWTAAAQECARACEEMYAKDYDHSHRKLGANNCAAACNRIAEGE